MSHGKLPAVPINSMLLTIFASVVLHLIVVSTSAHKNVTSYLTIQRCNAGMFCTISAPKVTNSRGNVTNPLLKHAPGARKTQRDAKMRCRRP